MKKKLLILLSSLLLVSCGESSLTTYSFSCGMISYPKKPEVISPLDTTVTFKMFNVNKINEIKDNFENIIDTLHYEADPYRDFEVNGIYKLNNTEEPIKVSSSLFSLIKKSIELEKLTQGKLNILMGSVIDLWKDKFNTETGENTDVDSVELSKALEVVPTYQDIDSYLLLDEDNLMIQLKKKTNGNYKTQLNLGAVVKGYALTLTTPLLKDYSSLIDCGASSIALMNTFTSERSYYTVSLKEPLQDPNATYESLLSIKVDPYNNLSVSGDEQQYFYFYQDGNKIYRNHILNPLTGYSTNYHAQVFLISKLNGEILDALSTSLMNIKEISDIDSLVTIFENNYGQEINYAIIDRQEKRTYKATYSSNFKSSIVYQNSRITNSN